MNPLWMEAPHIPWGSLGWRMGGGEKLWEKWVSWFRSRDRDARAAYRSKWPEPEAWAGFYDFIENGTTPPRVLAELERIQAAARPPGPDEDRISERYRFLWLVRHYLKRVGPAELPRGAEWAELYVEPGGGEWIVVVPKGSGEPYVQRHRTNST
jgi:hypothetical protein